LNILLRELTLPYPPVLNTYYRHVRGKILISKEGREYRAYVKNAIYASKDKAILFSRLRVEIWATMPDKRRRDLDGIPKAVLDALTHAKVWGDDEQIDELRIIRGHVEKPGKLLVKIFLAD